MEKSHKWWVISACCVFVLGISSFGYFYSKAQAEKAQAAKVAEPTTEENTEEEIKAMELIGQQLPEFTVTDSKGQEVSSQEFYDKPMIIVDWASWCAHCQKHLPVIQKVYEEYGDKINFVMINLTDEADEPQSQAESYIKEQKFTFPYFFDQSQTAADSLMVEYIPTTYFVDKNHIVKQVSVSELEEKELKELLDSLL
ncbi:TlpA family protein disulfide reductase [Streptococcus caprae]|uniref:TlpA family protein disulfide reductase n=1 Tax=Streptococcus caprae TaxID=1640501 RepID=A0ABV8CVK7_9STRE